MAESTPTPPANTPREPFFDKWAIRIILAFAGVTLIAMIFFWPSYQRSQIQAKLKPLREEKNRVEAIPYYEKALNRWPNSRTYYRELVEGYVMAEQPEKALETIERAQSAVEGFELRKWKIIAEFEANPTEANANQLVQAFSESPQDPALAYFVARYYAGNAYYEQAGALLPILAGHEFWNNKADALREQLKEAVFGDLS